jgi:hypothetical protein
MHVVCATLALPLTLGFGDTMGTYEDFMKWVQGTPEPAPAVVAPEAVDTGAPVEVSPLQQRLDAEHGEAGADFSAGIPRSTQRSRQWDDAMKRYEKQYDLPQNLLLAVAVTESGGKPDALSRQGARGLMQFMPATARGRGLIVSDPKSDDPNKDQRIDPNLSIKAAAEKLRKDLDRVDGNVDAALVRYNWGSGNYAKWLKDPNRKLPRETRNHLARYRAVLKYIKEQEGAE